MEWRIPTENDVAMMARRDTGFDKHYLCLYNRRFRTRRRLAQGWEFEVSGTRFYAEVPEVNRKKPRPPGYKKKTVTFGQIQHVSPFFKEIMQRDVPDPEPWTEEEALEYLNDHMDAFRISEDRRRRQAKKEAQIVEALRMAEEAKRAEEQRIALEMARRQALEEEIGRRQSQQNRNLLRRIIHFITGN